MATSSDFLKSFDEIFDRILTDCRNQELKDENGNTIQVDTSQGSLIYMKAACLASAEWGLRYQQNWIYKQIFADTAATENLEHHAWTQGLTRKTDEKDDALLDRYLEEIRHPPAGGNKYDWPRWAKQNTGVAETYVFQAPGLGQITLVVLADKDVTGSEIPDQALLDAVTAYIEEVRPVRANQYYVIAPTILTQDVTMVGTGSSWNPTQAAADIAALMAALIPGQMLYKAQLYAIAVNNGADNATITTPAGDVIPTAYQMARKGTINVT